MRKVKAEKVLYQSDNNFDWSLYDSGYVGGGSLRVNKSVKTHGKDKVFCHEHYAQELYDMYENWFNGRSLAPKDSLKGTVYSLTDVRPVSDHEVSVDTGVGMSTIIDLNKEKEYLTTIGCSSPKTFIRALNTVEGFKESVINNGLAGKVVNNGRVSLWEGHLSKIESEFMQQIKHPETITCAYNAKIESVNGGGFLVNILGVKCFLPGSLAAAGILTDFEAMVGKTIPVIVVNYIDKTDCFVVSYKKYLDMILPKKIETELEIGQEISVKVTGASKNGLFCLFKDQNGEWIFSGLAHRSVMSPEFEKRFDDREFRTGDEMHMYIANILEKDGKYRIVLTDSPSKIAVTTETETDE